MSVCPHCHTPYEGSPARCPNCDWRLDNAAEVPDNVCPHCGFHYEGQPDKWPNCDWRLGSSEIVIDDGTAARMERDKREAEEAAMRDAAYRQELEKSKHLDAIKPLTILRNPRYEYTTYYVYDRHGKTDQEALTSALNSYASEGWRLHTAVMNELGKNASAVSVDGIGFGTNSTADVMILIFERMIKPDMN